MPVGVIGVLLGIAWSDAAGLALAVLILGYLIVVLIVPEKF